MFRSLSFELRTVLKILQEIDPLAQEAFRARPDKQLRGDIETEPSLPEQGVVQDTDHQQNVNDNVMKRWSVSNELACYNDRWYIPPGLLRRELLRQHHDDAWAGHFSFKRTVDLLKRKFYWPKMSTDVQEYIDSCPTCRQMKARRHLPYGELQLLPIPTGPQKDWTLDFITDLPPSVCRGQVFDSILVVVDRYTKFSLSFRREKIEMRRISPMHWSKKFSLSTENLSHL